MIQDIYQLEQKYMESLSAITYAEDSLNRDNKFFAQLKMLMQSEKKMLYSEQIGTGFLDYVRRQTDSERQNGDAELFIHRLNALLQEKPFPLQRNSRILPDLSDDFERFLSEYRCYGLANGLKESSINLNTKIFRMYFEELMKHGCGTFDNMCAENICAAILPFEQISYLEKIRTLFRYLFHQGYLNRDYSFLVPVPKRPQPMPSVYSINEVQQIENAVDRNTFHGKRDYAALLLATRYGLRGGDICKMKISSVDFKQGQITLSQQKTDMPLVLPLLPEVETAISDYIQNERKDTRSPYLFLSTVPPYDHISVQCLNTLVRKAIVNARIDPGTRKQGTRIFRSSLASSMINDDISYEVVRKTLGHSDQNAIKSYVRLDMNQLRIYALSVPKPTDAFLRYLSGRRDDHDYI